MYPQEIVPTKEVRAVNLSPGQWFREFGGDTTSGFTDWSQYGPATQIDLDDIVEVPQEGL